MTIGLFYGSSTCYTEIVAEKIQHCIGSCIGSDHITRHNINAFYFTKERDHKLNLIQQYDLILLGISTWDFGQLQEDWAMVWDDLLALNLQGKTVALFGLGDQIAYGQWFLDAMGLLHQQLQSSGARFIGYWPTSGYQFEHSKALTEDKQHFVGLAIDEDNQYQLTQQRIEQWCQQILMEYKKGTS